MLISRHWLQKFFDTELPEAQELAEALTFHVFEIEKIEGDTLDVKVTPNRGHDCFSHRGIAKELSAILKLPLAKDPLQGTPTLAPTTDRVSVSIEEPTLSKRYIAGYIEGVTVGPSPAWLKEALEKIGQRSINNVVDATNYVMFDLGQPLHAFDAGKLREVSGTYAISVRKARAGEKMLALDGKEYVLSDSTLVIADKHKDSAIGIAGIKGGSPAGITEATKDIIIESANFDGVSVRKSAASLKLRTDASSRFEQGLSSELASFGMYEAAELIKQIAGGSVVGFVDAYPTREKERVVSVSVEKINTILGTSVTGAEVSDVFTRLLLSYKEEGGVFEVVVPHERLDIEIPEDLVEEIGRIIGYDKIAETELPPLPTDPAVNPTYYASERVREDLMKEGYSEVFTSVFAEEGERAVANKVDSVRPYLRSTLLSGLVEAMKKNIPNKDLLGLKEIKLFEIGSIWKDKKETIMVGVIREKEKAAEEPLADYVQGEPKEYDALPIPKVVRFKAFSKYPYIVRDIALWVPAGTDPNSVSETIQKEAGELCVKVGLFDTFEKAEKVSLAFRLIFQSFERTLTEIEANSEMEKVSSYLKSKGFEIR